MMTPDHARHRRTRIAAAALTTTVVLGGCGPAGDGTVASAESDAVTATNCGKDVTFSQPAERIYAYYVDMLAMTLAVGAADQIAGTAALERKGAPLSTVYGDEVVDSLPVATQGAPTFENVIAQQPDLFFAGWNYGYDPETNLTPAGLAEHDIPAYTLTESCRQRSDESRGIMPPWEALFTDLTNLGEITGNEDQAQQVVTDIEQRLDTLQSAP